MVREGQALLSERSSQGGGLGTPWAKGKDIISGLFVFIKVEPQHGNFVLLTTVQMVVLKGLERWETEAGYAPACPHCNYPHPL